MSNKKTCENCKHFDLKANEWGLKNYGYCSNPKVLDGDDPDLVEDDPSGVQVRKTFGCIHFEKK
jgi:hypothetical protein